MKALPFVTAFVFVASAAFAEEQRFATSPVPPYWTRAAAPAGEEPQDQDAPASRTAQGRTPLVVAPVARAFVPLFPCRLVDTRAPAFPAPLGGGFLPPATVRIYTLAGVCGVPANAQAISLNVTVVNPTGPGFIVLWPEGGAFPPVSTLNFLGHDVIVNAAVVPLSATGGISIALGVSGGDVILDTNGYYAFSVPAPTLALSAFTASTTGVVSAGFFGCLTFDTAAFSEARLDLPLPPGAVITGVNVKVRDGSTSAMSIGLYRIASTASGAADGLVSAILTPADTSWSNLPLTGLGTVTPASEFQTYYVDVTSPAHAGLLAFCGATVTYTLP